MNLINYLIIENNKDKEINLINFENHTLITYFACISDAGLILARFLLFHLAKAMSKTQL